LDVSETGWQYPPSKSTILRVYSCLVYSADQRRYFGMGDDLFRSHMAEICTPVLTHWFLDSRWRYYSLLLCTMRLLLLLTCSSNSFSSSLQVSPQLIILYTFLGSPCIVPHLPLPPHLHLVSAVPCTLFYRRHTHGQPSHTSILPASPSRHSSWFTICPIFAGLNDPCLAPRSLCLQLHSTPTDSWFGLPISIPVLALTKY